jgi:hypothetical protein
MDCTLVWLLASSAREATIRAYRAREPLTALERRVWRATSLVWMRVVSPVLRVAIKSMASLTASMESVYSASYSAVGFQLLAEP